MSNTQMIVTLGPSTMQEPMLRRMRAKGVSFVRVNLSHSSLETLEECLAMAGRVGLPFVLDTEGSQVRTGILDQDRIELRENALVELWGETRVGNENAIALNPGSILSQLEEGDLVHVDFDTLLLRVCDTSTLDRGFVLARVVTAGILGWRKAVVIDPVLPRRLQLPTLTPKDHAAIRIGLAAGVEHIAVSFVRSGAAVDEAREATQHRMRIISKIECTDALQNLDEILARSDAFLIDRGDLSKEIPIERIPLTQKLVIHRARALGKPVYVATNLLETMVRERKPTRAEVHDVVNTVLDGAAGLTLAAETAIGKYPLECINMLGRLIRHAEGVASRAAISTSPVAEALDRSNYLLDHEAASALVPAHGGTLVNRVAATPFDPEALGGLPRLRLDATKCTEIAQIGIGTYSPLEGFMGRADLEAVLRDMRLANGTPWPLPIVLDTSAEQAAGFREGCDVVLEDERGNALALLHLEDKYGFDREAFASRVFGTLVDEHPGVRMTRAMGPILLAGKITLLRRPESDIREYQLSPRQVRHVFQERGWSTVMGFHTRNVIHRGHEFIQLEALERENCDGLFVHPVIGLRKPGDFHPRFVIKSYETMIEHFYPSNRVVLAAFSTYSRYAGPREALFTALCRKNYGCSHFIVGRDHTGVGRFYPPDAAQRIFAEFPDLGITAVPCDEVTFSRRQSTYVYKPAVAEAGEHLSISGTEVRDLFRQGQMPPEWFMRPEISQLILQALQHGEEVFVD